MKNNLNFKAGSLDATSTNVAGGTTSFDSGLTVTLGYVFQFSDGTFKSIGLRWPTGAYHKSANQILSNTEKIICRWIIKKKN